MIVKRRISSEGECCVGSCFYVKFWVCRHHFPAAFGGHSDPQQFSEKTLNILSRLSATYNDIETLLVRITNSIDLMNTQISALEKQLGTIQDTQAQMQRELTRLADGTTAQGQVSKAIELARDGASASEIMLSTNLPKEEAEAIARFHSAQNS